MCYASSYVLETPEACDQISGIASSYNSSDDSNEFDRVLESNDNGIESMNYDLINEERLPIIK